MPAGKGVEVAAEPVAMLTLPPAKAEVRQRKPWHESRRTVRKHLRIRPYLIKITHFPDRHFGHRGYDKALMGVPGVG
jgi:hypothetical protein